MRDHDDGDDGVEDAPCPRRGEPAAEVAGAEREPEEPDDARGHGAGGEDPARVAVRVRDGSEEEHRVEVDVRVQPRQREARERDGQQPGARRRRRDRAGGAIRRGAAPRALGVSSA